MGVPESNSSDFGFVECQRAGTQSGIAARMISASSIALPMVPKYRKS